MQLSKKEEPINFEQLEKKIQEVHFKSNEGKELLSKLMTEPKSKLSTEEAKKYGELQAFLLNDDLELRRLTFIAVCLAVLQDKNRKLAEGISQVFRQQNQVLTLELPNMRDVDLTGWLAFLNILQVSRITSFDLRSHDLARDQVRWTELCDTLQATQISSLILIFIKLGELDQERWQIFCNALQALKLISFHLCFNNLGNLDQGRWQTFCNTLQTSKITSLYLPNNKLEQLDEMQWHAFSKALQESEITMLNLACNALGQLDQVRWQVFCNALQASKITSLILTDNHLEQLDNARWQAFYSALLASKVTSLGLSGNYLTQLNKLQWEIFCNTLQASNITSLDLRYNELRQFDPVRWQAFCNALQASKVTSLNLCDNNLGQLDQVCWQTFCDTIDASNITTLDLNGLNPDQMQNLVTLMKDNFHLVLQTADKWPSDLKELNERNRFLQQTLQAAHELINLQSKQNEKDYLAQVDKTLTDLDKSLPILLGKDTPRSNALRAKLQNYLEDLQWKKADWYREQAFVNKDTAVALTFLTLARDVWLSISSKCKYFEEAHNQLFQLVYNNVIQDPKANAHEAFKEALPYLVNEENQLINLSKENQKVFDNFLFVAAGGKEGGLDREFTSEQRLALLQYILLLEIKQNCEKEAGSGKAQTHFFKTECLAGLLDLLKNLSLNPKNLDTDTQNNLKNLWEQTHMRLQITPLSDPNTNILIEAINNLGLPSSVKIYKAELF